MLRPEQMSRVSVTGSKRVMDDVIEAIHDLRVLHVTEYDGSWDGFEPGDPVEGADEASEKLVTVRSLKSILGLTGEETGPSNQIITDEALDDQLEDIRQEVNELDDRRDDLREDYREVEEQIERMEPFVDLGIDLNLLSGYDSLAVAVGEGDPETVEAALAAGDVDAYEVFSSGSAVAAFAYTDDETLQDILVNATFTAIEIPSLEDAEASEPEEYLDHLRHRRQQLESKLSTVEDELEDLRLEVGGFLLAAEEELTIEAQKREAPLTFATTENAFVAEGWIPTDSYDDFRSALTDAVGDHVEIAELERADYDEDGHVVDHEEVDHGEPGGEPQPTAADGSGEDEVASDGGTPTISEADADDDADDDEVAADGGTVTMGSDEPPVIQNNPEVSKPFELLVRVINRPKYGEYDPTVIFLLTFPAMFGFMIGDLGYGLLYIGIGGLLYTKVDSAGWQALGGVAVWSGIFTAIFGILYGEIFGLHSITTYVWEPLIGRPPMHKGLQPAEIAYAQAWLIVSLFIGLAHLTLGYLLGFLKELRHGIAAAVTEKGSWVLMMGGVWAFIFSTAAAGVKPAFMYSVFGAAEAINPATGAEISEHSVAYALGFTGLPEVVGLAGLGITALGFVLLLAGEGIIGLLESLNVLVNVLSYARIAAVLLAKAGMAFVVNLLFFGAYTEETGHGVEFHFILPGTEAHGPEMFPGLIHLGIAGILFGLVVLVLGHLLVLALGITSAGLQAVRLEYVEFFGKFYEGGGKAFSPFGHERTFTADD
ncbi:MAG: V/A-type H+-transporting ATPase subunit I [Haloarculaceae archaeon]|jgi:V/A-type H+-transporting ATPase subunit I